MAEFFIGGHPFGAGVIHGQLNNLEVFADSSGMQVKAKTGKGWVKGHYYETDAQLTKSIAASDPTNPRDDRVVLRADFVNNLCEIAVLMGMPNASPTPPSLTQSTSKWEISLAKVRVDAAAGTIAAGKVTDERNYINRTVYKGTASSWTPSTSYQDIVTLNLPAGRWVLMGKHRWEVSMSAARFGQSRLFNFTSSTVLDFTDELLQTNDRKSVKLQATLDLAAAATVKLQVAVSAVDGTQTLGNATFVAIPVDVLV